VELAEMEKKKNAKTVNMQQLEALLTDDEVARPIAEPVTDKVEMKEVVSVLNMVYGGVQNFDTDLDDAFPLQQKVLICTLLLIVKNEKNKDITIGRLHDVYKKVCKNRNFQSIDLSEFLNLCLLVETRGILRITKKKEPRFHRIHLQWDEDEVFASLRDKQMITNILNERHLLTNR